MLIVALLTVIGGLALVTIATLWAVVRLTLYELQAGGDGVKVSLVERATELYQLFLAVVLVYLFGSGLAQWLTDAWRFVIQIP